MRGRWQALAVVVAGAISSLFAWISAAVIALVILRKGASAGAWLFLWALLPAGGFAYLYGDTSTLTLLAGTFALAVVLRNSVSLALALLASVAVGGFAGLVALTLGAQYLEQLGNVLEQMLNNMLSDLPEAAEQPALVALGKVQLAGMIGAGSAVMSALSLLLARYWQAALYNPGGFGREFRALRYPVAVTALLVLAGLGLSTVGARLGQWAMIFIMPLTFAGLAVVHSWGVARGRGTGWFAAFYIAWVLLEPLRLLVALLAVADSWLDFRQRWGLQERGAADTVQAPEEPQSALDKREDSKGQDDDSRAGDADGKTETSSTGPKKYDGRTPGRKDDD
jgi:hypothetical protein